MNAPYQATTTRVKVCGFTRPEDACCAALQGVDAIGLVFYPPSPRHVELDQAAAIVRALPPFVSVVGLFVDEEEATVREVLRQVPIDRLQFHGDESPQRCNRYNRPYIKAIRMRDDVDLNQLAVRYAEASALLLDAYHPSVQGGTGERFDWDRIPSDCALPIILAGGLSADNARQAITQVNPYALDVSSGVESSKGLKDQAKIAALMAEVEAARSAGKG